MMCAIWESAWYTWEGYDLGVPIASPYNVVDTSSHTCIGCIVSYPGHTCEKEGVFIRRNYWFVCVYLIRVQLNTKCSQ